MVSLEKGLTFDEVKEYANESQAACNEALYYCNDVESVQYLIDHKADVDNETLPITPLWYYTVSCKRFENESDMKYDIVKTLIKNGAQINNTNNTKNVGTPLFLTRDLKMLELLLKSGADVNFRDAKGNTALHINDVNAKRKLLEYGADINAKNNNGDTPLHLKQTYEELTTLLENGANVNEVNNNGVTPLHYQDSLCNIDLLVKYGADVNAQNYDGETPLQCIPEECCTDVVAKKLLSHGANVHIVDNFGETALNDRNVRECYEEMKNNEVAC